MSHDARIWRVVGDPLVAPTGEGPLDGLDVAVKDLFAVAGQKVGAGNPTWLGQARTEAIHAAPVRALLDAGAAVRGIARTDEFAYSLAGTNAHDGRPPNAAAPGRLGGGSSSGSAAAVAAGQADIGLGTDTGGSIRIPASYQGLYGIRPTHGAVSTDGLLPLAPTFDTVGWLTRDAATLRAVSETLLPPAPTRAFDEMVLSESLLAGADGDVRETVRAAANAWGATPESAPLPDLDVWREAFVVRQSVEAWESHGDWLATRLSTLGGDVRSRFEAASRRTAAEAEASRQAVDVARAAIRAFVGDRVIVMPAAPTVAPRVGDDLAPIRDANLRLTCLAGLGGLPVVCLPQRTADGLPCAVALVAAPGRDRDLLDLAARLDG
ncbi:MAG: amidase family protein [Aeromicrobium sp.]|uniref:amidase family protein n=1 Tax=Aeromicrobium sp. TaxID=1871063 RepID=UPI0039E62F4C